VVPGKRDVNVSRINKMHPGDWVFFSGGKRLYFGGTIALMWRNKELTTRLWGTDPAGSTWEYMYALSGTRGFDLAIEEIRRLLGWNPNRNIMGISVLGEDESETLQSLLTLDAAVADTEPADPLDEQAAVAAFDGELERTARRAQRGEQAALKRALTPAGIGRCALCGRSLPARRRSGGPPDRNRLRPGRQRRGPRRRLARLPGQWEPALPPADRPHRRRAHLGD
jgi:hypothetical protein